MRVRELLLLAAVLPGAAGASIVTERPSFSASAVTVPPGTTQLEAGYQYTDRSGSAVTQAAPFLLVRQPLRAGTELQLGWAGVNHLREDGSGRLGARDPSVGIKQSLPGLLPGSDVALVGAVSLPVGPDRLSTGRVEASGAAWWSLREGPPLFGGVVVASEDGELRTSAGLGVAFAVRERVRGFLEWFGSRRDGRGEHSVDAGLTFPVADDLQLDVYAGAGLDHDASDYFVGFGIGHRF